MKTNSSGDRLRVVARAPQRGRGEDDPRENDRQHQRGLLVDDGREVPEAPPKRDDQRHQETKRAERQRDPDHADAVLDRLIEEHALHREGKGEEVIEQPRQRLVHVHGQPARVAGLLSGRRPTAPLARPVNAELRDVDAQVRPPRVVERDVVAHVGRRRRRDDEQRAAHDDGDGGAAALVPVRAQEPDGADDADDGDGRERDALRGDAEGEPERAEQPVAQARPLERREHDGAQHERGVLRIDVGALQVVHARRHEDRRHAPAGSP